VVLKLREGSSTEGNNQIQAVKGKGNRETERGLAATGKGLAAYSLPSQLPFLLSAASTACYTHSSPSESVPSLRTIVLFLIAINVPFRTANSGATAKGSWVKYHQTVTILLSQPGPDCV
jgi:hypothetical protein